MLVGCSNNPSSKDSSADKDGGDKVYNIGVTQLVEHPSLDKTRKGFEKALSDNGYKNGENIKIDYQNAQNDIPTAQTIASKFASDKKDMIFAVSTQSAQAAYNTTKDIPIIITAVTDPVEAGLVDTLEKPGSNLSGTSDYISVDKNIGLIISFVPDMKNIGVIYNTSEANSKIQVDQLKEYASKNGYNIVEKGVSTSNEINQAMSSLAGKIDALYVPTDNLIVSSMPIVSKIANENKIPVIACEEGSVSTGALACQGIDYEKLGYKSGEMAVKVLKGEDISSMPIETLDETNIIINEDTLKALGLKKPDKNNITYVKTETSK